MKQGERLKTMREYVGLTQKQLSDGILSNVYLSQIEKGTKRLNNLNMCVKLSHRLGVTVYEFIELLHNDYTKAVIDSKMFQFKIGVKLTTSKKDI